MSENPVALGTAASPLVPQHVATSAASDSELWDKLKAIALDLGRDLIERALVLYLVSKAPRVPARVIAVAVAAIGYLVSPVDAVPDVTPVVGLVDDIAVISGALAAAAAFVTPEMRAEARRIADGWFS
jgi:uncharacterized membrane protein YkvA (DUF1232 family)